MRNVRLLLLLGICTFLPGSALADTYQLTTVAYSQSENFFGIDAAGDFTINVTDRFGGTGRTCGSVTSPAQCFETFYVGSALPVFSATAPALVWDDGYSCTPAITGYIIATGLCNGAHFLAAGSYIGN